MRSMVAAAGQCQAVSNVTIALRAGLLTVGQDVLWGESEKVVYCTGPGLKVHAMLSLKAHDLIRSTGKKPDTSWETLRTHSGFTGTSNLNPLKLSVMIEHQQIMTHYYHKESG